MSAPRQQRTVRLPLTKETWGMLQLPFPVTEQEWDRLIELLLAMRPGLVLPESDDETDPVAEARIAEC